MRLDVFHMFIQSLLSHLWDNWMVWKVYLSCFCPSLCGQACPENPAGLNMVIHGRLTSAFRSRCQLRMSQLVVRQEQPAQTSHRKRRRRSVLLVIGCHANMCDNRIFSQSCCLPCFESKSQVACVCSCRASKVIMNAIRYELAMLLSPPCIDV